MEFELRGEDKAVYGEKLFNELAQRLKAIKGIDRRSLYRFKDFYNLYPQLGLYIASVHEGSLLLPMPFTIPIVGLVTPQSKNHSRVPVDKLLASLSYTHFEQLLQIEDSLKRTFYEIACIKGTWSVKELKRQIDTLAYERVGLSADQEEAFSKLQGKIEPENASDAIKSVFVFDFLGLKTSDLLEEKVFETAILNHLQDFILELGNGFCFEARQKRILIDDEYFFIDLVFYHRILKCHVLVELKVDSFKHEHLSQLNTYVSYYREVVKRSDDNPPIGILLCTGKGKKLVEYALSGMNEQLFVSKYLLELPKKEQLEDFINNELRKWNGGNE